MVTTPICFPYKQPATANPCGRLWEARLAAVSWSISTHNIPIQILYLYLTASTFTFLVYAKDKWAARSGRWRTKESSLHTLALIGGWPGALLAQQLLRHKSRKNAFQFAFWATVVVNCAAFAWLFTAEGGNLLRSVISAIG